jgi:Cd2+/Zn2+-exporting ATPase
MEQAEFDKKEMVFLISRVAVSLTLLLLGVFYLNETNFPWWVSLLTMGLAWLIVSYDIVYKAFQEMVKEHNPFSEYMLMTIASIGAFALRFFGKEHNEYMEGVFVMLLYQVGEFFEDLATSKSKKGHHRCNRSSDQKASVIGKDGTIASKDSRATSGR